MTANSISRDRIVSRPKQFKSDGNILAIDYMRVFAIISVVVFHIYQMTFMGNHLVESTRQKNWDLYFIPVYCWLINIAMPLFMMISGYLFYYLLAKGKYNSWKVFLKKKTLRLIVPYFTFGIIMCLTTGNSKGILNLYTGTYWHLWYLSGLMWCFILGYVIKNLLKYPVAWIGIIVMSVLIQFTVTDFPNIFGIKYLPHMFRWFALGGLIVTYQPQIIRFFGKTHLHWLFLIIAIIIGIVDPTEYGKATISLIASQLLMLVSIWYITYYFSQKLGAKTNNRIVQELAQNSFGLYIFHNWIGLYLIGNFAKRTFGIEAFAAGHPYLYPFLFFIVTLTISFTLSYCIRKTQVGRFLLG